MAEDQATPHGLVAPGVGGGIKVLGDGSASPDGKGGHGGPGRGSFRQRKLNRLSGGAKRKYDPFEEPLPIMYRVSADSRSFEKMVLPTDALAASWRDYHENSPVSATYAARPKPPGLFDTVPISRNPDELLVANTRSALPKARRQRELFVRDLTVRIARRHLGYCIGREIREPLQEELDQINGKIRQIFPDRSMTAAEVKCWCYHERPLTGEVHKYYTDALAAYMRNSNDVIDLLLVDQGRFANLPADRMAQIKVLSRAIRFEPVEERDGMLYEIPDLLTLKGLWPTDTDTAESITLTKNDKTIKLTPLASSVYQVNFTNFIFFSFSIR